MTRYIINIENEHGHIVKDYQVQASSIANAQAIAKDILKLMSLRSCLYVDIRPIAQ